MFSRIVSQLAPGGDITRISEGDFIRLRDHSILFACSRFNGSAADDARADLICMRSRDEGETWSEPRLLLSAAALDAVNVMSVSFLRMQRGDLGLFLIAKTRPGVYRIFLLRSRDEGGRFDQVIDCQKTLATGNYVVNNSRVIRLSTGRILIPLAHHRVSHREEGPMCKDSRATAVFLCSDDDGDTFYEAPDTVSLPFPVSRSGLQEPGLLELRSSAVWAYFRTDLHAQYEAFSYDGGLHWTPAQPSRFTSPLSPMKVARHPLSGELFAVWNPVPAYVGRSLSPAGWGRNPLVLARSRDDGATWSEPLILEDDEQHGYCYPALFFTEDGGLLLSYCSGGPGEGSCLARTTLRKLSDL